MVNNLRLGVIGVCILLFSSPIFCQEIKIRAVWEEAIITPAGLSKNSYIRETEDSSGIWWQGFSIRISDFTGREIIRTRPIYEYVSISGNNDHIVAKLEPDLRLGNRNSSIVICYDTLMNIKLIFPPEVQHTETFYRGVSEVSSFRFPDDNFGYVDTCGRYIFYPKHEFVYRNSTKLFAVEVAESTDDVMVIMLHAKTIYNSADVQHTIYIPTAVFNRNYIPEYLNWYQFVVEKTDRYYYESCRQLQGDYWSNIFHDGVYYLFHENLNESKKCFVQYLRSGDGRYDFAARKNLTAIKKWNKEQSKTRMEDECTIP